MRKRFVVFDIGWRLDSLGDELNGTGEHRVHFKRNLILFLQSLCVVIVIAEGC